MSAIVGIFYLDGHPVTRAELGTMLETLHHRGIDGSGIWTQGEVGFGHRMSWTTPESLYEILPTTDAAGSLTITADARIDNREELIRLLGLNQSNRQLISDSSLILAAYERWGESCIEKLLGDYAFAIWDSRRRSLLCARDPMGVKHFYYYHCPNRVFAFASEIKALLSLHCVPRELNELSVAYHLLPIYDDKKITAYKNIHRLPALEYLRADHLEIKTGTAWQPDLSRELRLSSNEEYAEAFREVFSEAIRCRLRSAFRVGSMLSGGLDSSSITCVASKLLADEGRERLHTFSAIWPSIAAVSPKIDERPFMEAVLATSRFDSHFVRTDLLSPLTEWRQIYWHTDDLMSAPNMYMDWAIFKAAHSEGVRVLLGGTDGDTVVSYGYQDLEAYVRKGKWVSLLREARALSRNMPRRAHRFKRLVWGMAIEPTVPEYVRQCWRLLHGRSRHRKPRSLLPPYSSRRPINPEFVRRVRLEDHLAHLSGNAIAPARSNRESHWNDISSGTWSYILETFEKAAAAHSVEVRYPFFDRRLVEFCLALPPGQRIQNGYTRSILRRAMTGLLPAEVQWRVDKGNLSAGVNLKLLEHESETLDEIVYKNSIQGNYIDPASLQAIYERFKSDPLRASDEAFSLLLTATLALWLQSLKASDVLKAATSV